MVDIANIFTQAIANTATYKGVAKASVAAIMGLTIPSGAAAGLLSADKQEVTITVGDTSESSDTATITSVSTSLSLANYLGEISTSFLDDLDSNQFRFELTNSTTVTATRHAASTDLHTHYGEVLTFDSTYVSEVFHGTIAMSSSQASLASSSHNATKANCLPVYLGSTSDEASDNYSESFCELSITGSDSAVTVTADRDTADTVGQACTAGYAMIEFVGSEINSLQISTMTGASSGEVTASLATVVDQRTISWWSGHETNGASGGYDEAARSVYRKSTTQVASSKGDTGDTVDASISCVEFANDNPISSVELENAINHGGATQTDTTLGTTLDNTTRSFVSYGRYSMSAGAADYAASQHSYRAQLTSTSNVRVTTDSSAPSTYDVALEVIQSN